jgi:hypothetical protein
MGAAEQNADNDIWTEQLTEGTRKTSKLTSFI